MLRKVGLIGVAVLGALLLGEQTEAGVKSGLEKGTPELKSAGPLTFGPEGILFVGDTQSAAVFAIDTGDAGGGASKSAVNLESVNEKIAGLLGTGVRQIRVNDLAVNPASGNAYLSVARGRGPDAQPVILRVTPSGDLAPLSLENVPYSRAALPDAPPDKEVGQGRRRRNPRRQSITDLAYVNGRLFIAGLSNEEFASKLRSIPFPFSETAQGASVEIYHGSHGRFETRSPVRTFVPYEVAGEPHLLAAYTCTPLVKFPVSQLQPGEKVRGVTVAELGNRNRPLDMIVYRDGGKDYLLMANSSRGVMKISTENLDRNRGITEEVEDTAGQAYETIAGMEGVVQLDRLDDRHALVLVRQESGALDLKTVPLP